MISHRRELQSKWTLARSPTFALFCTLQPAKAFRPTRFMGSLPSSRVHTYCSHAATTTSSVIGHTPHRVRNGKMVQACLRTPTTDAHLPVPRHPRLRSDSALNECTYCLHKLERCIRKCAAREHAHAEAKKCKRYTRKMDACACLKHQTHDSSTDNEHEISPSEPCEA
jgi:hypothetical protein